MGKNNVIVIAIIAIVFLTVFWAIEQSSDSYQEVETQTQEQSQSAPEQPQKDRGEMYVIFMNQCTSIEPTAEKFNFCECTYDYLIENYGKGGFLEIGLKLERTGQITEEMQEAAYNCISDVN